MLGNRQLAMLREMGVRVWQPAPVVAPVLKMVDRPIVTDSAAIVIPDAINNGAARAHIHSSKGTIDTQKPAVPIVEEGVIAGLAAGWVTASAHELYAPLSSPQGARWLVLLEAPSAALTDGFNPLEGDAGKLLDNMLRAALLHCTGGVTVVPLVRSAGQLPERGLSISLAKQVASLAPAVIFIMGRLAAQAVLQSSEPLAKLRGRVHQLHGTPTIVSMEPTYLLRNLPDKAKAWEDLCLALSVASVAKP